MHERSGGASQLRRPMLRLLDETFFDAVAEKIKKPLDLRSFFVGNHGRVVATLEDCSFQLE